jgi:hypothetical protein
MNIYLGLVHYPVLNKFNDIVTTSITNLDIHDIARTCKTFGIKKYFIINPLETQKLLLDRILKFWKSDNAEIYNSDRVTALSEIEYSDSVENTIECIKNQEEECPVTITTTAANLEAQISISEFKKITKPILILFGTGNGLAPEIHNKADFILSPIIGNTGYNHLSVRSAAAIVLDRLTSEK